MILLVETISMFIGTNARQPGDGIHRVELDLDTGAMTARGVVAATANPSFLTISPNQQFLYTVSEVAKEPVVIAYKIDEKGSLTELNRKSTGGNGPCHVTVEPGGKCVLAANYGGGSFCVFPTMSNGQLVERSAFLQHPAGSNVNTNRQKDPHAHSVNVSADGKFAVVADLGCDKLFVYKLNAADGTVTAATPTATAPGAGPRHFTFHPNGKHAFAINELNSTLSLYRYDAEKGTLTHQQTLSTLPDGYSAASTTAEVLVHPNGKFVYGSNRGHDSIALFEFDADGDSIVAKGHTPTQGKTPRNFGIDPSGKFLIAANQGSGTLVSFRIDAKTGALTPTGHTATVSAPPVCVKFWK